MLKRIAVMTSDTAFAEAAEKAAAKLNTQVIITALDADVPPAGTTAIVLNRKEIPKGIESAIVLSAWGEDLLALLSNAVDCREGILEGSGRRIMDRASRFAQALGLSPEDQMALERGALVRDIGKTRVTNDVLLKSGLLTYDEWQLIRKHPRFGAEIASEMPVLQDLTAIIQSHHECYDGTGYPDGLEGEAIPYLARIMKILDVYCAMTSPRHYRKTHSTHEEAVEHLRSEQGKHFDPHLVEVFITGCVGQ